LANPTGDAVTLDSPIVLVVGGSTFEPTRDTVLPSVAAGGSAFTTLHFDVIGQTSVGNAILRIGALDRHQGIVPLQPGAVVPVLLKPVDFSLHGTAVAGDLRLLVSHGELRWDLPDWADELPAGTASLTLTYDVTYGGSFIGGTPFTGDNVGLLLPNGQVVRARSDGLSQSIAVIGPGKTLRRQFSRFEIPAGLPGTYALVLYYNGKQGRIRFTLPS
jgi:hypothetical protein